MESLTRENSQWRTGRWMETETEEQTVTQQRRESLQDVMQIQLVIPKTLEFCTIPAIFQPKNNTKQFSLFFTCNIPVQNQSSLLTSK